MGGGKEPPIDFLKKHWLREVEEVVDISLPVDYESDAADDAAADVDDEQMEEAIEFPSSLEDPLMASLNDVSRDEYGGLWPAEAFQCSTATDSLEVASYAFATDGSSDSCFPFDVQSSQHAYASPELEAFQFEESFHWQ